jgi:cation transport ATPase
MPYLPPTASINVEALFSVLLGIMGASFFIKNYLHTRDNSQRNCIMVMTVATALAVATVYAGRKFREIDKYYYGKATFVVGTSRRP